MNANNDPDISELRQWRLLKQLHNGAGFGKLGPFLKENGFPYDATQKPWGKYYAHIRNKYKRCLQLPAESQIEFIDRMIQDCGTVSIVKELAPVNRLKFVEFLDGINLEEKRKIVRVLKDLTVEEQLVLIGLLPLL